MEDNGDFLESSGFILDFSNTFIAPAVACFVLGLQVKEIFSDNALIISGVCCLMQTFLFYFAIFMTRASEHRSAFYIKWMPELTYYAAVASCAILPVLIVVVNTVSLFGNNIKGIECFLIFTILVQVTVFVFYVSTFRGVFLSDYSNS